MIIIKPGINQYKMVLNPNLTITLEVFSSVCLLIGAICKSGIAKTA